MSPALWFRPLAALSVLLAVSGCGLRTLIYHEDPTALAEDRSEEAREADERIRSDILSEFVVQEVGKLKNITVDVYESAVLLTGTVAAEEFRATAGRIAGGVDGVGPVVNEIQVVADASLVDAAEDLSIENRLKARLRDAEGINSFNLRWHSVNGTVYMFGRARTPEERDRALKIAREVPGVTGLVDHISVRAPTGVQSWLDNLL